MIYDLDDLINEERKTFKIIDQVKKKREKVVTANKRARTKEKNENWENLYKEVPFDRQISYNLLESLIDEDEMFVEESKY